MMTLSEYCVNLYVAFLLPAIRAVISLTLYYDASDAHFTLFTNINKLKRCAAFAAVLIPLHPILHFQLVLFFCINFNPTGRPLKCTGAM